jgi:phosphoribosylaminoimidazole carboxylase
MFNNHYLNLITYCLFIQLHLILFIYSFTNNNIMFKRIGILGGGQLAMMMTQAAHKLGHRVFVLDPTEGCPASIVGAIHHVGSFRDSTTIHTFVTEANLDVLTWDIESVDADTLIKLKKEGNVEVHPDPRLLKTIQNKWDQKYMLHLNGFKKVTNDMYSVDMIEDNTTYILKTKYGGYDGKGVWRIETIDEMNQIIKESGLPRKQFYCEEYINHACEFAMQICLHNSNIVSIYPLVHTVQDPEYGICLETHTYLDNKKLEETIEHSEFRQLEQKAKRIAKDLGDLLSDYTENTYTGILAVEFFLTMDDELLINELSPRVHNSGHYTIEGCYTSQFESHISLITDSDFYGDINTQLIHPEKDTVMVNILGGREYKKTIPIDSHVDMHWYHKNKKNGDTYKLNRKIGHYTYEREPSIDRQDIYVIMGSKSDLPQMQPCIDLIKTFNVSCHVDVISAHRTPDLMFEFAHNVQKWGGKVVIAAAGGAAHLPGMVASITNLPVIGVPIETKALGGQDSLYSIVQMPDGVPVATVGIGKSKNAAILAFKILGRFDIINKLKGENITKVFRQRDDVSILNGIE